MLPISDMSQLTPSLILEAMLDSSILGKEEALALATANLEKLLGLDHDPQQHDLVATANGDLLGYEGKVVAVISPRRGLVDVF